MLIRKAENKDISRIAEIIVFTKRVTYRPIFKNDFVSAIHAKLSYHNKYWLIKDNISTNGIFVNGKKEKVKELEFGDVIYIMGLKIIVF